jgi:hypothetical protein
VPFVYLRVGNLAPLSVRVYVADIYVYVFASILYSTPLRLRLRLRLIYCGKINRQGDAAQGTRLLSRGLTLLV